MQLYSQTTTAIYNDGFGELYIVVSLCWLIICLHYGVWIRSITDGDIIIKD